MTDLKSVRKGDVITVSMIAAGPLDINGDVPLLAADGARGGSLYARAITDGSYRYITITPAPRPIEVGDRVRGCGFKVLTVLGLSSCGKFAEVQHQPGRPFATFTANLERVDD